MRARGLVVGVTLLALAGCAWFGQGSSPVPGVSVSVPVGPRTVSAAEATALVRAGATELEPVASAPITAEGELRGGTFHVFEVRSTDSSTRLQWVVTHPTLTGKPEQLDDVFRRPYLPVLVVGDVQYQTTEYQSMFKTWWPVMGNQYRVISVPRPTFSMYGPLPAGVGEVEVSSTLISEPLRVPVQRGADVVPAGSEQVPIRGRVVYGDAADEGHADPLIVTVHGVRRWKSGTVLYYSSVFPEGAVPVNFWLWGGRSNALNRQRSGGDWFTYSFGLVDRQSMRAYGPAKGYIYKSVCDVVNYPKSVAETARVCWAVFPALDEATTSVDVVVGGQQLVQSVPVEVGEIGPVSAEEFPELGTGWPEIPEEAWARLDAAGVDRATSPMRDVVVEGAITSSGRQLDLDAQVLFEYNQATLTAAAREVIAQTAEKLRGFAGGGAVTVTGHTDSDGGDAANLELSRRRAQAVADALAPLLGSAYSFVVEGRGEAEPVAPNDTEAGKAMNRRVTIVPPR